MGPPPFHNLFSGGIGDYLGGLQQVVLLCLYFAFLSEKKEKDNKKQNVNVFFGVNNVNNTKFRFISKLSLSKMS